MKSAKMKKKLVKRINALCASVKEKTQQPRFAGIYTAGIAFKIAKLAEVDQKLIQKGTEYN